MRDYRKKELLLLSFFRKNARESLTKISRSTKIPVSTIFDKLRTYETSLIRKHTTLLDFTKIGYLAKADVMVQVAASQREELKDFLKNCDHVNSLYKVNNGYDYLVEFIFKNMRNLEDFMDELEQTFEIRKKQIYYLVEDLAREKFMSNPDIMKVEMKNMAS